MKIDLIPELELAKVQDCISNILYKLAKWAKLNGSWGFFVCLRDINFRDQWGKDFVRRVDGSSKRDQKM